MVLDSADTEMLPTYFQTQTSIISFHLQSFNRAGILQYSTGQTKIWKKCCSAAKIISLKARSGFVCVVLSLLHASSRASHIPSKVYCSFLKMCSSKQPHSLNSGQQRNTTSAAALYWAKPKNMSYFAISDQACQCLANAHNTLWWKMPTLLHNKTDRWD